MEKPCATIEANYTLSNSVQPCKQPCAGHIVQDKKRTKKTSQVKYYILTMNCARAGTVHVAENEFCSMLPGGQAHNDKTITPLLPPWD